MSGIWSRINPACRCLSCTCSLALKRPTAARLARRLQFKHLTTLFYSSVIATAAAVDVKAKQTRRKQWDLAIANAERCLHSAAEAPNSTEPRTKTLSEATTTGNTPTQIPRTSQKSAKRWRRVESSLEEYEQNKAWRDPMELCSPSVQRLKTEVIDCEHRSTQRAEKLEAYTMESLDMLDTSRQPLTRKGMFSVYADKMHQEQRHFYWTPGKLSMVEHSVAKLCARLLLTVAPNTATKEKTATRTPRRSELEELLKLVDLRIREFKKKKREEHESLPALEFPHYTKFNDFRNGNNAALQVNGELLDLFRGFGLGHYDRTTLISRLAEKLLRSSAPPDIVTFTLIINRFSRLRMFDEANMTIEALLETNMRMNETTVPTILAHYTRSLDKERFKSFVPKLLGFYQGMGEAHPLVDQDKIDGVRRRNWKGRVIEAFNFDENTYRFIIAGYLRFGMLGKAYSWVWRMHEAHFQLDLRVIGSFIWQYARRGSWHDGLVFLRWAIEKVMADRAAGVQARADHQAIYFYGLELCKNCGKPQHFKQLYGEGLRHGFTMRQLLKRESLKRGWSREEDLTYRLKRKLEILEHKLWLIMEEVLIITAEVIAAEVRLSAQSMSSARGMCNRHAIGNGGEEDAAETLDLVEEEAQPDSNLDTENSDDISRTKTQTESVSTGRKYGTESRSWSMIPAQQERYPLAL